jgi:hypothetical protein
VVALAAGAWTAACGRERPAPERAERLEDLIASQQTLHLEENDSALNVNPVVALDPRGGFLVADAAGGEGQIRRYADDGRLLWKVGRKGGGPGEFESLALAVRLGSGEVLAADRGGQLTVFDSAGAALIRTIPTPLKNIEGAVVVNDSIVLFSAVRDSAAAPRLHLWNLRRDRITASFFAPFSHSPNRGAATTAGWTEAAVRGDTIAAIFATSDTVYFFTTSGRSLGRVPLPSRAFRRVTSQGPKNGQDIGWLESFDLVATVHWLSDGTLLVPYESLDAGKGLMRVERKWHLLKMTRSGELVFELLDAPRLLQVDPRRDALYLVDPAAEAPNQWLVARLRR